MKIPPIPTWLTLTVLSFWGIGLYVTSQSTTETGKTLFVILGAPFLLFLLLGMIAAIRGH